MYVGSVLNRGLQLDVKARETFFVGMEKESCCTMGLLTLCSAEGSSGGRGLYF